jgi:hypothetical protein
VLSVVFELIRISPGCAWPQPFSQGWGPFLSPRLATNRSFGTSIPSRRIRMLAEQVVDQFQGQPKVTASGISAKASESFDQKERRRREPYRSKSFEIYR